jgi:hypothetical protein
MPIQATSPSDLIRQKRLQIQTNANPKPEWGGLTPRYGVTLPIKITAINSNKYTVTPSQKRFTAGLTLSATTHVKLN